MLVKKYNKVYNTVTWEVCTQKCGKMLVNEVIPNKGDKITPSNYRKELADKGYNFFQQIGSMGGAITGKSVEYDLEGDFVKTVENLEYLATL